MIEGGDGSVVSTIFGTAMAGVLALLGWHSRKQSDSVTSLLDRTARLEATAVNLEQIRAVLREEVGVHIKDGDRRIDKMEEVLEKLSERIIQMQQTLPRRWDDRPRESDI